MTHDELIRYLKANRKTPTWQSEATRWFIIAAMVTFWALAIQWKY
jgi:hypothetical protein